MDKTVNKPLLGPLSGRLFRTLAFKWTLAIALLLALGMGLLGTYLIQQQEGAFERQSTQLGQLLAEQFARLAAEPLLAEDLFQLDLLVRRQLDDRLVVGAAVIGKNGEYRAVAGLIPSQYQVAKYTTSTEESWIVRLGPHGKIQASIHLRPVVFQDVQAGEILLSLNRAPLEQDRRLLINALVATTFLLIVFVGLLAFPLARWMSDPIRRLAVEEQRQVEVHPTREEPVYDGMDELGYLTRRLQRLAIEARDKAQVEDALNRYLSPNVVRSVLEGPAGLELEGRSIRGSVLFCDIVDFTRFSRRHTPEELAELVNDYFGAFARSGTYFNGTVDKFIGDCVMILFGVPEPDREHALQAVMCGAAIIHLAQAINVRRRAIGKPTVDFRVAVNSGLMRAGNLGSPERMEFTVVGSSVNLAARLCERSPINSLALTADTLSEPGVASQVSAKPLRMMDIKGYDEPLKAFVLRDLAPKAKIQLQRCLQIVTDASEVGA